MEIGTAVMIVGTVFGITIPTSAVIIKSRSNGNGNGNGKTGVCPLHATLIEDIKEIKEDVKRLIIEVASMGRE